MADSLSINNILSQVKKLDKEEQLNLLQRLVPLLKKNKVPGNSLLRLTSLTGLDNEVWKNTDLDKYIDTERQW